MTARQYPDVASKIRRWAGKPEPNITFGFHRQDGGTHSLDEMANDGIEFSDMLTALRGCRVTDLGFENGEWRYRAEGRDRDGRALVFIVNVIDEEEEIEIVTAWAVDKGK